MKKVILIVLFSIIVLSTLILKTNNYSETIAFSVSPTPTVTPIIEVNPVKVFNEINQFRIEEEIPPLTWAENLCPFAEARVNEIQTDWSHKGFYARGDSIFPDYCPTCYKIGENLAVNFYDERSLVNAWIQSPDHYPQLLNPYKNACVKELNNYVVLIVAY